MHTYGKPDALSDLQIDIEALLQRLRHPVLVENEIELMDLTAAQWRLNIEFGKLIFSAWNAVKSFSRRVEAVAYRDRDRFGVFVRRPGSREAGTLEFRELGATAGPIRSSGRTAFRHHFAATLERDFPGWKFERMSNRSDREHSFSAWYTRGIATMGRSAWAFLGLSADEGAAAADNALAFGLIWLHWLRSQADRMSITHLKLFLPPPAVSLNAHRAAYLNPRALKLEVYEWQAGKSSASLVDLRDYGNVETRLARRRDAELLKEIHANVLRETLGNCTGEIELVPDSAGVFSSLRVAGLEVARVEGRVSPRVYFGLEGACRRLDDSLLGEFRSFLDEVRSVRRAASRERQHEYYRLQSERWLESMLFRDITRLDPALSPAHVYSQVPAFSGTERGVIDLLTVTRSGRLAVVELKIQEEINLPLQGLDYWLRVNWLHRRKQFQEFGYFLDCALSSAPPLLYLVSPAFRFHSTTEKLLSYLDRNIETTLIGINADWRQHIKVLFRHAMPARR
jgi:hypothetical protein